MACLLLFFVDVSYFIMSSAFSHSTKCNAVPSFLSQEFLWSYSFFMLHEKQCLSPTNWKRGRSLTCLAPHKRAGLRPHTIPSLSHVPLPLWKPKPIRRWMTIRILILKGWWHLLERFRFDQIIPWFFPLSFTFYASPFLVSLSQREKRFNGNIYFLL